MTNRTCEAEGCFEEAVIECQEPSGTGTTWYCAEHATKNGFCYLCGYFEAGRESFDFSPVPGVCAECLAEMESEQDWYDGDEEDEFDEYPY